MYIIFYFNVLLLYGGRRVSARLTQNVTLRACNAHHVRPASFTPTTLAVHTIRIFNNNTLHTRVSGQCDFSSIISYY